MKKTRAKRSKNISGVRIAAIRKQKGMTQAELAEKVQTLGVNLDRAAVAKIENGLRCVLDYEIQAIASTLRVSVATILVRRD